MKPQYQTKQKQEDDVSCQGGISKSNKSLV